MDLCMDRVTFLTAGAKFLRNSREKDEFCLSDRGIFASSLKRRWGGGNDIVCGQGRWYSHMWLDLEEEN